MPESICTPECDKVILLRPDMALLSEFLEWICSRKYVVGRFNIEGRLVRADHTSLIVEFFDIDEEEMEREKRAFLAALRRQEADRA